MSWQIKIREKIILFQYDDTKVITVDYRNTREEINVNINRQNALNKRF